MRISFYCFCVRQEKRGLLIFPEKSIYSHVLHLEFRFHSASALQVPSLSQKPPAFLVGVDLSAVYLIAISTRAIQEVRLAAIAFIKSEL
ncbi:hypothetical protein SLA2020_242160 [Shorea laevis]